LLGDKDGGLSLNDFHSGEEIQLLQAHKAQINNIVYHPHVKYQQHSNDRPSSNLVIMTSGHDRQIKFWEILYSKATKRIQLSETKTIHAQDEINCIQFTAKGEHYAVPIFIAISRCPS
jgi:WD40 repeat protein